jgi:hypothetical protein
MKNLLGHAAKSLSIRGMEHEEGHHHMFDIVGTHTDEDHWQECK